MSDKPVAGLVTFAVIAPLMVLCCAAIAAPLLFGSFVAAITTWFGGFDPVVAALFGFLSVLAIVGILRQRKRAATAPSLPTKGTQ